MFGRCLYFVFSYLCDRETRRHEIYSINHLNQKIMKTFKQMTCAIAAALMAAGMMTSCSGGGNTPAKDGPFGKLPAIYKEAGDKGYEIGKKLFDVSSEDEAKKIMEDVKALKEQMEKDATEAYEAMKGKEIPTEVSEEVPMWRVQNTVSSS